MEAGDAVGGRVAVGDDDAAEADDVVGDDVDAVEGVDDVGGGDAAEVDDAAEAADAVEAGDADGDGDAIGVGGDFARRERRAVLRNDLAPTAAPPISRQTFFFLEHAPPALFAGPAATTAPLSIMREGDVLNAYGNATAVATDAGQGQGRWGSGDRGRLNWTMRQQTHRLQMFETGRWSYEECPASLIAVDRGFLPTQNAIAGAIGNCGHAAEAAALSKRLSGLLRTVERFSHAIAVTISTRSPPDRRRCSACGDLEVESNLDVNEGHRTVFKLIEWQERRYSF